MIYVHLEVLSFNTNLLTLIESAPSKEILPKDLSKVKSFLDLFSCNPENCIPKIVNRRYEVAYWELKKDEVEKIIPLVKILLKKEGIKYHIGLPYTPTDITAVSIVP